jgi:hypothetical protein
MPTQTFTTSGTWTAPADLASGSTQVYAWGEGGNGAAAANAVRSGGGGGGGAFGGESALGGITPGSTVLTITIGTGGTGTNTTVTGGSVTVQANAGANAATTNGGAGGTAGSNSIAFAGGTGGLGQTGTSKSGGGGGGSAGSTGAGGAASTFTGGTAGTGAAGPPSLAGAAGPNGTTNTAGANGNAPGSGAAGGGDLGNNAGGTGGPGQVVIEWSITTVTSTGSFALAPLAFSASGSTLTSSTGSFSLAPLKFSGTATVAAAATVPGGLLNIAPGPTWLALYKPGLPRPHPPAPAPATKAVRGSLALAPLAFSGTGTVRNLFIFIGHYPVSYPDYVDATTLEMLSCLPGDSYNMYVVSFRPGLTDPPLDGRWLGVPGLGDEVIFVPAYADALVIARAHNAALQAVNAVKPFWQATGGTPRIREEEPREPSEASKTIARARARNAELQARRARGEKI